MTDKELERLNVKIAKKLGWKSFRKERLPDPLQKEKRMTGISPGNFRHQFVPYFTNNLAYAMQCVDWATNENRCAFELSKTPISQYTAHFIKRWPPGEDFTACGTLPSIAICKAFLKIKKNNK